MRAWAIAVSGMISISTLCSAEALELDAPYSIDPSNYVHSEFPPCAGGPSVPAFILDQIPNIVTTMGPKTAAYFAMGAAVTSFCTKFGGMVGEFCGQASGGDFANCGMSCVKLNELPHTIQFLDRELKMCKEVNGVRTIGPQTGKFECGGFAGYYGPYITSPSSGTFMICSIGANWSHNTPFHGTMKVLY